MDALLERGIPVRALVRRVSARTDALQQRGVEIRKADITDRSATTDAFTGVAGVFAMTTPFEDGPEAEIAQGQALVDSLVAANVPHVVFSSVADADRSTGIPHFETKARTEAILRASTVPFTIVGPPTSTTTCSAASRTFDVDDSTYRYRWTPRCSRCPAAISSPDMRAMFQFLTDTGYDANIDGLRREYPEVGWQKFTDWFTDWAAELR